MTTSDDASRTKANKSVGQLRGAMVLEVVELLCVATLLVGVGRIYVPAALILGGVLGVWACERASGARRRAAAASRDARAGGER